MNALPKRWLEALRVSFGLPSGLAMLAGILLGLSLPAIDDWLGFQLPALAFDSQSSTRSLLETIGTATVSVAGLSFSVTIVALTLASSQLSPRVLRTFRGDRLSQTTLALFLGTFVYCLTLLVRLGVTNGGREVPDLSVTLAVLLAFSSFLTFAFFIAHIVNMLEPSTVVDGIYQDGVSLSENRYPSGPGEPQDCEAARRDARSTMGNDQPGEIVSPKSGYLTVVDLGHLVSCLQHGDAFVKQAVPVGTYVLPGQVLAEVWARGENREELHGRVLEAFELGKQRTLVQDTAFCVRQLADVALKGLSPGINDPTTSENAMDAMASLLVTFIKSETPCEIRVDDEGVPRFLALAPDLNDLVKLGFDQVVVAAKGSPVVISRLLQLLEHIETQARANGVRCGETDRQRRALRRE
ncbi:MAG: DUF2254 domain-containing protein [Solirubrobacterales bacterium]|nr:DUF2254 domain-containing protein [Solirubrobacterales bacterium]